MTGQCIFWCWAVSPATEYGNSIAETPCRTSSAPQRNAANASARARTDSGRRAVRSIPYTAPASSIRSRAHCPSAADLVA
jgi:hypothetical protein